MLHVQACNVVRQSLDGHRVTNGQKCGQQPINPAMQATSDRTDLFAIAFIATIVGFMVAASTGSIQAGVAVGSAIFLLGLLLNETPTWSWNTFSWGPFWGPHVVVQVPPPRRDPRVIVVPGVPARPTPVTVHVPVADPVPHLPSSSSSHGIVGGRRTHETHAFGSPSAQPVHVDSFHGSSSRMTTTPPTQRDSEYGIVGGRRL